MINEVDVWLGNICGCDYYMSQDQFEYWKYTRMIIDIVKGRGSGFSLEVPEGVRFVIYSSILSEEEYQLISSESEV